MAKVRILLAAYNGSKYIRTMIDSILAQDNNDWELILSDDGSTDDTDRILEEYANAYPNRIVHYRSGQRFGCAQKHFMHLLGRFHDAEYLMFCDQDDRWYANKISMTLDKMTKIEIPGKPAMVHTDLRVVDDNLQELDPSFMHYSGLDGQRLALRQLLVQNVVTGCTMMINSALAELAVQHSPEGKVLMHDWWLALLAAAAGTTGYVGEATMDYRQHDQNVVGAQNIRSLSHIWGRIENREFSAAMRNTYLQGEQFARCFRGVICEANQTLLDQYGQLAHCGYWKRRVIILKNGFYKYGIARVVAQMIWA